MNPTPAHQEAKERPILFSGPMVRALLNGTKTQTRRIVKKVLPIGAVDPKGYWGPLDCECIMDWDFLPSALELLGNDTDLCPHGQPGDRLWVRETWIYRGCCSSNDIFLKYVADGADATIRITPEQYRERLNKAVEHQRKYCPPPAGDENAPDFWEKYETREKWLNQQFTKQHPSIFMPRWASRITLEVVSVRVERLQDISEGDAKAEGTGGMMCQRHAELGSNDWPEFPNSHKEAYEVLWESINGKGSWADNPFVWVVEFKRLERSK